MTKTGLVSITFRQLTPQQITDLCQVAGVDAIEWGGDVHVPHGDLEKAREVAAMTREAGLEVASYGSYYRTVDSEAEGLTFASVLDTAVALGAPTIRVWPGTKRPVDATPDYREAVAANLRSAAEQASARGVGIALEFHANTLTETLESAVQLLEAVNHPNLKTLWQPTLIMPYEQQMESLLGVRDWIDYFHVYTWDMTADGKCDRKPLADGEERWKAFFAEFQPPYALIEFVKGDAPEQFLADAEALKGWLA